MTGNEMYEWTRPAYRKQNGCYDSAYRDIGDESRGGYHFSRRHCCIRKRWLDNDQHDDSGGGNDNSRCLVWRAVATVKNQAPEVRRFPNWVSIVCLMEGCIGSEPYHT